MNLAIIERLELLRDLYGTIHVPIAVWNELVLQGEGKPGSEAIANAQWIQTHVVQNQHLVTVLREHLDQGESEAIALALELNATMLLLDETEGRRIAELYGLNKTGILGILLKAQKDGKISSLKDEMNKLRSQAHFWISEPLYNKLLRAAGE
jgi:hypothetical protein